MKSHTLVLLHLAVFLAGWTGIFGRLISLSGLPLVWYRMSVSIVFAAILFGELQEVNWSFWLGISLIIASVAIQTLRVRSRA